MELMIEKLTRELDSIGIKVLNRKPNIDPQSLRRLIYDQFTQELQTMAATSQINKEQSRLIEEMLARRAFQLKGFDESIQGKRGRPLKNVIAEEKLSKWIKEQNRTSFYKKEIDKKFKELSGSKRCLASQTLQRILKTYGLEEKITITKSQPVKKNQKGQTPEIQKKKVQKNSEQNISWPRLFLEESERSVSMISGAEELIKNEDEVFFGEKADPWKEAVVFNFDINDYA